MYMDIEYIQQYTAYNEYNCKILSISLNYHGTTVTAAQLLKFTFDGVPLDIKYHQSTS